jgi:3-dehydroquinate synthase
MQAFTISGSTGRSNLLIGERLEALPEHVPLDRAVIVTDETVSGLYGARFPQVPLITVGCGEEIKTLETASWIYRELIRLEADRTSFLLGIGGGVVCDLAGFVASTYLRGLRFGLAATTLLAQVDASVGGKNGVNLDGYKNMIGLFNQPEVVLCDLDLLPSLLPADVGCGLAEIVKHGAIADAELFGYLEAHAEEALRLDRKVVERLVADSVLIKSNIVNQDERETGERRKLNFGHTFGHAVEKTIGAPHGEAVSRGMVLAGLLSVRRGLLSEAELQRLVTLLERLKLPTVVGAALEPMLEALGKDKKREGRSIRFVLLKGIGEAVVESIPLQEIREAAEEMLGSSGRLL